METESQEEAKNRIVQNGEKAKRLLQEKMLVDFFKEQEASCFEALKRLPLGASWQAFQVVKSTLDATLALKETLEAFMNDYSDLRQREEFGEVKVASGI